MTTKTHNLFSDFTNLYSLSKTLRFELEPIGKTEEFLKKNKIFEKDQTIDNSYNQAKFYFDTLHQCFIDAALTQHKVGNLSFSLLTDFLEMQSKKLSVKKKELKGARDRKDKSKITLLQKEINDLEKKTEDKKKEFYKEIRLLFDAEAENWRKEYERKTLENGESIQFSKTDKKQQGVKFLTASGVLKILKFEFPESKENEFKNNGWPSLYVEEEENQGKKRYIFDSFDRFAGYLSKFQQTRDNLYTDDGISTAVATRIISNFDIFLANKKTFENKYKTSHQEIGFTQTHIFEIDYYRNCLLQKGIEVLSEEENSERSYNKIIGKINQHVKEYRDQKASEAKQNKDISFKISDCPLFKMLEKQILGKVEKEKQLIEKTEDKTEEEVFVERFREFIDNNEERFAKAKKFMMRFFTDEFINAYENVYLNKATINTISRRWFTNSYNFEQNLPQASKDKKESDEPKVKKFVSLADIKNAVEQLEDQSFKQTYYDKGVIKPEQDAWEQFLTVWKNEFENLFIDIQRENGEILKGYDSYLEDAKKLQMFARKKEAIAVVKNYADASLRIYQIMKYLALDERDRGKISGLPDTNFYAELDEYAKDFQFIKYYNAFRNFITRKPYSEESIKLNFDKGNLLTGWAESPKGNAQFCGYILRKNNKYYLAISKYTHFLDVDKFNLKAVGDEDYYEKLEYTSLNWGKNIAGGQVYSSFTKQMLGNGISYQGHKEKLSNSEHVNFVKQLIRTKYLGKFSKLKEFLSNDYSNVKEMQDAFSKLQFGGLIFINVKASWVDRQEINDDNKTHQLFLFEILNRDLRDQSKATQKNMHTLYWNALFSNDNLNRKIFNLLGNAEIFFRKATKDLPIRKNEKKEEYINKHGEKIVINRRYSRNLIKLHIPISVNATKRSMQQGQVNKKLNSDMLTKCRNVNVIGLDRGEKNLLYFSIINQKGEILDQGSLNKIKVGDKNIDFYDKLVTKEKERLANRQSWQQVTRIKDLKKGYISHVISKICRLIIEYNAIVVLEDLNMRFKQIRGGIERSIYQQFEKALIDKLGYLVFKNQKDLRAAGGVLNGYQLAAPFVSFEKMGKQTGIIFYTQADYTSVTDPLSGFRKNLYISNSAPQEKIKEAIQKFKAIGWDEREHSYFFTYNPMDFVDEKYKDSAFSKNWTVYAKVPRICREKNRSGHWECKPIDLNQKFEDLFKLWQFDNQKGDICKQIQEKESTGKLQGKKELDGKERGFYHSFVYLFNLILQLRNSYSKQFKTKEEDGEIVVEEIGEDIDFIASSVKPFFSTGSLNKKGEVLSPIRLAGFDERIVSKDRKIILNGLNGDANGAYNIARKGAMILNRIKEKPEKPDLYISKLEWDEAVTDWDKYVSQTS